MTIGNSLFQSRDIPITKTWPALLLLIYVFHLEADWRIAFFTALFALLVSTQMLINDRRLLQSIKPGIVSAVLAALFFFIYFLTLAPDILPADSGEFQVVAANLGIAHPPGFALYTMLAHLMTQLPIGPTVAYRVNLLSAFTGALTLALVYAGVYLLTKKHLASLLSVIALGSATTFWAQATTANIRSLSAMFTALLFLLLLAFYDTRNRASIMDSTKKPDRLLILFALFLGLGLTHHASLIFMGLIFFLFILMVDPNLLRSPWRWWRPILAFLLGLLPVLYLVFRASSGARGASPDLATLPGFLEHVLAIGFRGDLFTYLEPALFLERLKIMVNVLAFQFNPLLIGGMMLGLLLLFLWNWKLGFLVGGSFLIHTLVTATYRAPQTVEYMLPAYIALVLMLGFVAGKSNKIWRILKIENLRPVAGPIFISIFIVAALWQMVDHYPSYQTLHRDTTARGYAQPLLENTPDNGVILADWHWVTPLWYLQEVEGLRQDVEIRFVFPEGEPYAQTWARRIGEELGDSHLVISTHYSPEAFADLPHPEPVGEAFLFRTEPRLTMPSGFSPINHLIGDKIQLIGYQFDEENIQIADELIVTIAWQPAAELDPAITLFTHLVDSNNQIFAQQDLPPNTQEEGVTLTQFRLTPRLGASPGDYTILFGASDGELMINDEGQDRTLLTQINISAMDRPQITAKPLNRQTTFDPNLRLVGYDWDKTLPNAPRLYLHWQTADGYFSEVIDEPVDSLPPYIGPWGIPSNRWTSVLKPEQTHYVPLGQGIVWQGNPLSSDETLSPGQNMTLYQQFLSGRPVMRDYVVSTRLIGFEDDGFHWAWWDLNDAVPAMGAIPTLKWITGSYVRSPHFLTVNPQASPDQQIGGAVNLYDAFTNRRLPILDERLVAEYGWIPLGLTRVDGS